MNTAAPYAYNPRGSSDFPTANPRRHAIRRITSSGWRRHFMTQNHFHKYQADLHIHCNDHIITGVQLDVYAAFEAHAKRVVAILGLIRGLPEVKAV